MRKWPEKKIMKALYRQCKGDYHKMAIWLKGSKSKGDGTYSYQPKCSKCGK